MTFSFQRAMIIARREYLTTVRRPQFVFSLLFTPALMFMLTFLTGKMQVDEARKHLHETKVVAVVDSSGLYSAAPREYDYQPSVDTPTPQLPHSPPAAPASSGAVPVLIRPFASQAVALDSLKAGTVNSVLVIASDFLQTGGIRRYEEQTRVFTSSGDDRAVRYWLSRNLLAGRVDSVRVDRLLQLGHSTDLYVPAKTGGWALKDDARELIGFFLPFILGFLLSMSIIIGGQYMLQGLSEEKETRILESMLCTVTPDDLMLGKLVGLGGAGLTMVGAWVALGLYAGGGMLAVAKIDLPPMLALVGVLYFLLGYLFFGSLMTGIGAIANNLREAQQYAMTFTMLNFVPIWFASMLLASPNSKVAIGLSLFPPTAPTAMMMRLSSASMTGTTIPMWQLATSLGLLALTAVIALNLSARIFRLGLLLYGKTPNLPEIMKLLRQS